MRVVSKICSSCVISKYQESSATIESIVLFYATKPLLWSLDFWPFHPDRAWCANPYPTSTEYLGITASYTISSFFNTLPSWCFPFFILLSMAQNCKTVDQFKMMGTLQKGTRKNHQGYWETYGPGRCDPQESGLHNLWEDCVHLCPEMTWLLQTILLLQKCSY